MNFALELSLFLLALVAITVFFAWRSSRSRRLIVHNALADGVHENGIITLRATAAIATRHLLAKWGADGSHLAVCGASDWPLGIVPDEATAAEELVQCHLLGATVGTRKGVASEAIALTDELYTAANGKLQNKPVVSGTYYLVGRPVRTAAADGDQIEFVPCYPVKLVVP